MNKTVLLTLAVNFLYVVIFGQRPVPAYKNEELRIDQFSRRTVTLNSSEDPINLQNVKSFEVVDARPDTNALGLALIRHTPFFAVLAGGFVNDIQQFLDSSVHFVKRDSFSVVMVVKKFWITAGLDEEIVQQIQNTDVDTSTKKISSLLANIEFYLKRGSDYFILYRFDTTISRNAYVSRDASELAEQGLRLSLIKLKDMETKFQSISETKRKFTWNEIEAHIQKQFDIPILKDSVLVRGVYFSFEEFKNNNPRQRDFEVDKDKLADLIFIKQSDGKNNPVRDAWGYCDGKNLYVRSMENYFLLQREENAFYIYGAKEFKHKKLAKDPGINAGPNTVAGGTTQYKNTLQKTSKRHLALELKPYALNWDNGELN